MTKSSFIIFANCDSSYVIAPFSTQILTKQNLGLLVVVLDILTILSIVLFTHILSERQEEYIQQYNAQVIQMSDFTLRVKNLPNDSEYGENEEILKAQLFYFFQTLLSNNKYLRNQQEKKYFQISDITLGKNKINYTDDLINLYSVYQKLQKYKFKQSKNKNDEELRKKF